ncbi:hypothetical protein ROJ8625_02447 [Roseivivax jejudonensis]|uniref:Uncharacterized protein n=1 Tax=Roseivivax jejudonensis TaxID=1529041 RepID=A0A1X6ZEU8_9RHOB|nr:hypothetical protein [Roseivivax jejudonensis]SLN49739.1 hypothetical protein ROJ8625_02447 [Roseivivax jejudonensis]
MCEPGEKLKLCTCTGPGPLKRPYWTLKRRDPERADPDLMAVGSCEMVRHSFEEKLLRSKILEDINRFDAFDTEMTLADGDILELALDRMDLTFRFTGGRWQDADDLGDRRSAGDLVGVGRFSCSIR